jgi:hypothetical protein
LGFIHSAEWVMRQITEWGFSVLGIGQKPTQPMSSHHFRVKASQSGDWAARAFQNGTGFADGDSGLFVCGCMMP